MDPLQPFGVDLFKFMIQMAIWLVPTIWALTRIFRYRSGIARIPLILLILWAPILGAIGTLIFLRPKNQAHPLLPHK